MDDLLVRRVVARFLLRADLSPPLGYPGGPCQVVDRIEQDIRNPRLREQLVDNVEHNEPLSNPDAAKVYRLEHERGVGVTKQLALSPHSQYRMDLRAIPVPAIRAALASYSKLYFQLKSQKGPAFQAMDRDLHSGKVVWTDPKLKLTIVFTLSGANEVTLITAYWVGDQDPKARPGECDTD